uniref:Helicase ATP-binding domain-containing protein n=1 Tax=Oncorhynchus mykiss TaxID=8022 RepID=A0A8C7Q319_ONCMY
TYFPMVNHWGDSDESNNLLIYQHKAKLQQAVKDNSFLVVTGETGSGKTTQRPNGTCIGITQPRRVAAITVAQRVSQEMHFSWGREVGYQVCFDDCTTQDTLVKYMTDGCLLREILADLVLSQYSVVILDEAHERIIWLYPQLHPSISPLKGCSVPLKVVVMSATLETDTLSVFLGGCPVFTIPGRTFPVIKVELDVHTSEMAGDILVFLTGLSDIEKACDMLYAKDRKMEGLLILPLYRSMLTGKISGTLVKQLNHNSRVMDLLKVERGPAGRAGRTSAGTYYSQKFWDRCMQEYTIPEIQRTSLTAVILTLKLLAVLHDYHDSIFFLALVSSYQYPPPLCGVCRRGKVTQLGELMVEFPLPPGLTRALLQAVSLGFEEPPAACSHPEKQKEADQKHRQLGVQTGSCNDFHVAQYNYIHRRALKSAFSEEIQLREFLLRIQQEDFSMEKFDGNKSELFSRCLCTGYFTRGAQVISEGSAEDAFKKLEKRNDESSVNDARSRYLQRKQERQQGPHSLLVLGQLQNYIQFVNMSPNSVVKSAH